MWRPMTMSVTRRMLWHPVALQMLLLAGCDATNFIGVPNPPFEGVLVGFPPPLRPFIGSFHKGTHHGFIGSLHLRPQASFPRSTLFIGFFSFTRDPSQFYWFSSLEIPSLCPQFLPPGIIGTYLWVPSLPPSISFPRCPPSMFVLACGQCGCVVCVSIVSFASRVVWVCPPKCPSPTNESHGLLPLVTLPSNN